jgi:hypothetical protein
MHRRVDSLLEPKSATANKDAERREERPVEALSSIPERMGLIRGASAAEHADEQENLDCHGGKTGCSLGSQSDRTRHPRRNQQRERFGAIPG